MSLHITGAAWERCALRLETDGCELCWRREDGDSPIVRDFARFVQERSAAQVQQAGG